MRNNEIKNEIDEIKKWEEKIKRENLKYERKKFIYDFRQCETVRSFGDNICISKINIDEAEKDHCHLI